MARFVPFIIKTDGSQNISVKIVRMKKSDAVQTEKKNPSGKQAGCQIIFRMMPLKSMP